MGNGQQGRNCLYKASLLVSELSFKGGREGKYNMRIFGTGAASPTSSVKKKEKSQRADGSFGSLLDVGSDEEVSSASASGVQSLNSINSLISLQMVDDQTPRKRVIEHGNKLLDYLDELRHDLLVGNVSAYTANKIIQEIRENRSDFTDPKLKEIIDDIELRAAVELAKLGSI